MYRVIIKNDIYSQMDFEFASMEEVFIFTETVIEKSVTEVEVAIKKTKEEE